jgi:hypothetical protein
VVTTKLLLGLVEPSNFPVVARLAAHAASSIVALTLYGRTLRYNASFQKVPKRDRQFPGECNNADFAATHAGAGEPLPPPRRQRALRLVAQPRPSQFDQGLPHQLCPGLADAAIPADIAACVGRGGQADERRRCRRVSKLR